MKINSKRKGNKFEQDVAFMLRKEVWPECRTSRFMGSLWEDSLGIDLTGTSGFNIQCKAVERLSPGYHEILSNMPQGKNTNIVIHKRNNKGIIAAIELDDLIQIIKKANESK